MFILFCLGDTGTPQYPSVTAVTRQDPLFNAKCDLLGTHIDLELFIRAALQKGLFRKADASYFEQVFKRNRQEGTKELVLFLSQSDQRALFLHVLRRSVEMGEGDRVTRQQVKGHEVLLREWALLEEQQQPCTTATVSTPLSDVCVVCVRVRAVAQNFSY